jgi:hypothetical protein
MLPFWVSDAALIGAQAATVALPRRNALRLPERLRSRWWALVPLGSIVAVIFGINWASGTAHGLAWLALIAVPPLAAAALGGLARGGRLWLAPLAGALLALAWVDRHGLAGQAAGVALDMLSCATLGVLLATITPASWLKVGIVLMAVGDSYLVITDLLQPSNDVLNAAVAAPGLPQLQRELFGSAIMGYGDLFIAGVLGAVLANEGLRTSRVALLVFVLAALFDLLFFTVGELPATVPVAVALVIVEAARRRRRSAVEAREVLVEAPGVGRAQRRAGGGRRRGGAAAPAPAGKRQG